MIREQAKELIAFANTTIKTRYNIRHQRLDIKVNNMVYLRLYHGYTIQGLLNRKLIYQRIGPFKVIKKVGRLTYRLELSLTIRIYLVILV